MSSPRTVTKQKLAKRETPALPGHQIFSSDRPPPPPGRAPTPTLGGRSPLCAEIGTLRGDSQSDEKIGKPLRYHNYHKIFCFTKAHRVPSPPQACPRKPSHNYKNPSNSANDPQKQAHPPTPPTLKIFILIIVSIRHSESNFITYSFFAA